jgi:hypothetical protein
VKQRGILDDLGMQFGKVKAGLQTGYNMGKQAFNIDQTA